MVVLAGYSCNNNYIEFYDSETTITDKFYVKEIDSDTTNSINVFFECITKHITKTIDYLCVYMSFDFTNEYRKTFVKSAKDFGIKNVRIIGSRVAIALEAILTLSKTDDILLFLFLNPEYLYMDYWVFSKTNKWILYDSHIIYKAHDNKNSILESVREIKEIMGIIIHDKRDNAPSIVCLGMEDINEKDFTQIFPRFEKLTYVTTIYGSEAVLNYARFLSGENEFSRFDIELFLDRYIFIKSNSKQLYEIIEKKILPFSQTIYIDAKEGDFITMHKSKSKNVPYEFSMKIKNKGRYEMNLDFDINGISTITCCNMAKTVKTTIDEMKTKYNIPLKVSNYDASLNAVGIDLGTTECCAAVIRKNGPDFVVLDPFTSLRTMPSYIGFDEKEPKCGQIVVNRMRHSAKYSIFDIKRIIGRQLHEITVDSLWPFKILSEGNQILIEYETVKGPDTESPEKITSILLGHIKKVYETYQSKRISEVVISIPSEFSEAQKTATKNAVEYAGFEKIHFIPEPIAAAFAYFSEMDIPNQSNILICDCGGGTVDICVATIENEQLTILSHSGDAYLGGRDFDKILFNHFNAVLKHKFGIDVTATNKKYILKQKCQDIKHTLSSADEDWLDVNDFDMNIDDIIKITRTEFEAMTTDILLRIKNVVLQTLIKSEIQKRKIDFVFQVGGGCRMPMIKDLLADIFPDSNHQCNIYPDWIVAHGASLYAYYIKQSSSASNSTAAVSNNSNYDNNFAANQQNVSGEKTIVSKLRSMFKKQKINK